MSQHHVLRPGLQYAARRLKLQGTWEVKNYLLHSMSFNDFVWTELYTPRHLYATTLLGFLRDQAGEVDRSTARTGNSCTVYSYIRAIRQQTTTARSTARSCGCISARSALYTRLRQLLQTRLFPGKSSLVPTSQPRSKICSFCTISN